MPSCQPRAAIKRASSARTEPSVCHRSRSSVNTLQSPACSLLSVICGLIALAGCLYRHTVTACFTVDRALALAACCCSLLYATVSSALIALTRPINNCFTGSWPPSRLLSRSSSMSTPTLIDIPPSSGSVTPSDMDPSTPNSTTTSLSALSTVAIKDGHQGSFPLHPRRRHHHHHGSTPSDASTTTLDAERADRISHLAGLDRLAAPRSPHSGNPNTYFSSLDYPAVLIKDRSTVGSASGTASTARTSGSVASVSASGSTSTYTWGTMPSAAPSSVDFEQDEPDQDHDGYADDGVSSVGGFSDEGSSSLVAFGEGANSTLSGPISTAAARMMAARTLSNMNNPGSGGAGSAGNNNVLAAGGGGGGSSSVSNSYSHNHNNSINNYSYTAASSYNPFLNSAYNPHSPRVPPPSSVSAPPAPAYGPPGTPHAACERRSSSTEWVSAPGTAEE